MNLPEEFIRQMQDLLGEEYPAFVASLDEEVPVSIRINDNKLGSVESRSLSTFEMTKYSEAICEDPVLWCDMGRYLKERPSFTFDPEFHAGCYYVQEASSMFLGQAIKTFIEGPVCALDLCAAPGGKSTHLSSLLEDGSLLVSNEVIRSRANILAENTIKWGNPSVIVTNNDPAEIGKLTHSFDLILTDVPCSGEGMFRKDSKAINEWSPANVNLCAERQRRIVADIWPALKPEGILVYSTCTYNTRENEENVSWIANELGGEILEIPVDNSWNIKGCLKGNIPVYRFMPHRTRGEGFFMTVIRKKGVTGSYRELQEVKRSRRVGAPLTGALKKKLQEVMGGSYKEYWLHDPERFYFFEEKGVFSAFPLENPEKFRIFKESLKIICAGITLGEIKGKDIIPSHHLALSTAFNRKIFPEIELDKNQAIRYLRKEALFDLPESCSKGYNIVSFEGHPLGFVKNIGNRANNLYPQEWRIRSNI
ncbi:rRNA cytosine-C5-methyltransferase [Bacteroidia bacterium]|nr:rRNA cytosine-C5-methyltransferase [Bacteroidia bacterium]